MLHWKLVVDNTEEAEGASTWGHLMGIVDLLVVAESKCDWSHTIKWIWWWANGSYILPFNLPSFVHGEHDIRPSSLAHKPSLPGRTHFSYVLLLSIRENDMKFLKRKNGVVLKNNIKNLGISFLLDYILWFIRWTAQDMRQNLPNTYKIGKNLTILISELVGRCRPYSDYEMCSL